MNLDYDYRRKQMLRNLILEYLSNANITMHNININKIKSELKQILKYEPAVDVEWDKEKMINEDSGEEYYVETLGQISIIYGDDSNNMDTITFSVNSTKK